MPPCMYYSDVLGLVNYVCVVYIPIYIYHTKLFFIPHFYDHFYDL